MPSFSTPSFSTLLSTGLLLPYFGWGIYLLRRRYRFHEESTMTLEIATVGGVAVFLALELFLLSAWMRATPVLHIFAALGLVVATSALYGPISISLISHLFVEMVMPAHGNDISRPDFSPAEALERLGDYDGALKECMIIARIFPKDPSASLRIGENYFRMEQYEDCARWFDRGLSNLKDPERSLRVTNRLAELHVKHLEQPDEARRVLENFLERFPESERAGRVRERIERLTRQSAKVPVASPPAAEENPEEAPSE